MEASINERCEIGRIEQRDQVLREIDETLTRHSASLSNTEPVFGRRRSAMMAKSN
jgi:hypothetical protein